MIRSTQDLQDLVNVAHRITEWEPSRSDLIDEDEQHEEPGRLFFWTEGYTGATRDVHGDEPIYHKVTLEVSDGENIHEAALVDCTVREALDALHSVTSQED